MSLMLRSLLGLFTLFFFVLVDYNVLCYNVCYYVWGGGVRDKFLFWEKLSARFAVLQIARTRA